MMAVVTQDVVTDLLFRNNFPTFVIENDKEMETSIIRIGNSRGIIIPSAILKKLGVKDNAKVLLKEREDGDLSIHFIPDEEQMKTRAFLDACAGSWSGSETVEEIMQSIKEGNVAKEILVL